MSAVADDRDKPLSLETARADRLAWMFECTVRRVQQLAKDGVIPKASRGEYPLDASVRNFMRYKSAGEMQPSAFDPDRLEPFKRRAFYQGTREQIALREMARELMPRQDFFDKLAASLKSLLRIRALRDYLERDGVPPDVIAIVEQHVETICVEIYEELGKLAEQRP